MIAGFIVLFLSIVSVAFYQLYQLFHRLFFGNVLFDALFLFVETDLAPSGTHIAIIGICHFPGSVDNASHDAYLDSFQISCG